MITNTDFLLKEMKNLYKEGFLKVSINSDAKDNEIMYSEPDFYVQANKKTLDMLGFKPNFP